MNTSMSGVEFEIARLIGDLKTACLDVDPTIGSRLRVGRGTVDRVTASLLDHGDLALQHLCLALERASFDRDARCLAYALEKAGKRGVPYLIRAAASTNVAARVNAISAIVQIEGADQDEVVRLLDRARYDQSPRVRELVITSLGDRGRLSSDDLEEILLSDDSDSVKVAAVKGYAKTDGSTVETLLKALRDPAPRVRSAALEGIAGLDDPPLEVFATVANDPDPSVKIAALRELVKIGGGGQNAFSCFLGDSEPKVRRFAVEQLPKMGEPALALLTKSLNDEDHDVQTAAIRSLAALGAPAIEVLDQFIKQPAVLTDSKVESVKSLGRIGQQSLEVLATTANDPDQSVRVATANALLSIGVPALDELVRLLEDPYGDICWGVANSLISDFDPEALCNAIIVQLVVRDQSRPAERFSSEVVVFTLQGAIKRSPHQRESVLQQLCQVAYGTEPDVTSRAVSVARSLDSSGFASLVKAHAEKNPAAAIEIMSSLGGPEATAYFSEVQSKRLADFRVPLLELEQVALKRWEDLTRQATRAFYVNMGLSIALFVVGTGIVLWGLILLTRSSELSQQVVGGLLAGISALATTYSGRFWKDPVEHVQNFSAQQARLQAAFIGYMNRIAQLRLVFESNYTAKGVSIADLEAYQKMLDAAMEQASRQLGSQVQM